MLNSRNSSRSRSRQRGATAVEFGIIAVLFFTLFFGIIEFGRFFYLYNTVQEVTRCAARQAAVTWRDSDSWDSTKSNSIQQQCLFGHDELVAGKEIQKVNVRLRALNINYGEVSKSDPASVTDNLANCSADPLATNCIRFVEASVQECDNQGCEPIQYQPMIGIVPLWVDIRSSTVIMPAESLGYM